MSEQEDVFSWLSGRDLAERVESSDDLRALSSWLDTGTSEAAEDLDDAWDEPSEAVTHTRKNVADMTAAEVRALKSALASINTTANPAWGRYVLLHRVLGPIVHGAAHQRFLPWHRLMVWKFERLLRRTSEGGGIYIPYWTWWQEAATGRKAVPAAWADFKPDIVLPTLSDADFLRDIVAMLASDVRTAMDGVGLVDMINLLIAAFLDPAGNSMLGTSIPVTRIARATLVSGATSASPPGGRARNLPDRSTVQATMSRTSFWSFSNDLEGVHGSPHMWVGDNGRGDGRMADIQMSPADVLFFFHHAEVDRLWQLWANTATRRTPWTVTGAELPPWSETITQMMSISAAPLEFVYENRTVDDPTRTP